MQQIPLADLLQQVRACSLCEKDLPLGPRPVVRLTPTSRILIIGQAPGTRVTPAAYPGMIPPGIGCAELLFAQGIQKAVQDTNRAGKARA